MLLDCRRLQITCRVGKKNNVAK